MNGHKRADEGNGDSSRDPPNNARAQGEANLQDRLVACVEEYPGRRTDNVMLRLDASAKAFQSALDEAAAAGRVEVRSGIANADDSFLLTPATTRFWDNDATQPLFEDNHQYVLAVQIIMFPGSTTNDLVTSRESRSDDLAALAALRRRGLVKTHWTLRGRMYEPTDVLLEWGREVCRVTPEDGSPAAIAQALRDTAQRAKND